MPTLPILNPEFGISQVNNITIDNLTSVIANMTEPIHFFANVNQIIFGGILYFSLLVAATVIMYLALQQFANRPIVNAMYSTAMVSIVAFFLRVIEFVTDGVKNSLINDYQLWIFPLIAMVLAGIAWAIKDR